MNQSYKFVAIDADGTLLDINRNITQRNKTAIQKATALGVKIVLCSGRSYHSLRFFADELGLKTKGNYVIAFNGGMILNAHTNAVLYETKIEQTLAKEIVTAAKPFSPAAATLVYRDMSHLIINPGIPNADLYLESSRANPIYAEDINSEITGDVQKVLIAGHTADLQAPAAFLTKQFTGRCNMMFSGPYLFECNELHTTKSSGIQTLCQMLGISMSETIAIGDNFNDVSMIQAAGLGVCMANGEAEVKAKADYVTANDCNNSGVAEVLEKFILQ